ncbi:myb-binding protein 1A [Lampetra fluviatilis]
MAEEHVEEAAAAAATRGAGKAERGGLLAKGREFLDIFWDIPKEDQDVRLRAIRRLIDHLKSNGEEEEMQYSLRRLVDGLVSVRDAARPGFTLALAQVLASFESLDLLTILSMIKERLVVQKAKKRLGKQYAIGNVFGVLALAQSGRLMKEPQVLLAALAHLRKMQDYEEFVKNLPMKAICEIVAEVPEDVFRDGVLGKLHSELSLSLRAPDNLNLLLTCIEHFPDVVDDSVIAQSIGTKTVVCRDNVLRLVGLLKQTALSVTKNDPFPPLCMKLVSQALKEGTFQLLWKEVVEKVARDKASPCLFLCLRLLGHCLPVLSIPQIQLVLTSDVMKAYGEYERTKMQKKYNISREVDELVEAFLLAPETDDDRQLAVVVGFCSVANRSRPFMPGNWGVVRKLSPVALRRYVAWLRGSFLSPDMDAIVDFTPEWQYQRESTDKWEGDQRQIDPVGRLRRWIVERFSALVENSQVQKDEELVLEMTRFVFFHSFFHTMKPSASVPESQEQATVSLDHSTRMSMGHMFFSLLHHLNNMRVLGDDETAVALNARHSHGVRRDGTLWVYTVACLAEELMQASGTVRLVNPLSKDELASWNRTMKVVSDLRKKSKKIKSSESAAFQVLLLSVALKLFQGRDDCSDILTDLQACIEKATAAQKMKAEKAAETGEPGWVEVMVEILLSLLSQKSRLLRHICGSVFARICPNITAPAFQLILDVFNVEKSEDEDGAIMVVDLKKKGEEDEDDEKEESSEEEEEEEAAEDSGADSGAEDEDGDEKEDVDENFRLQLMKVLQEGNAWAGDDSNDEDIDNADEEAMNALDENLSALFLEHKKKLAAKREEKDRFRGERRLKREFRIKVLDLVEIFLNKRPESPLAFDVMEPLLAVIRTCMRDDTEKQEEEYLRKTVNIFQNSLCKARKYCRELEEHKERLHGMLENLVKRAGKQNDPSVGSYFFSGSLYCLRVLLSGASSVGDDAEKNEEVMETDKESFVDADRVVQVYRTALAEFLTRRNSSYSTKMFVDLLHRLPSMGLKLHELLVKYIDDGAKDHQQGQACVLLLKALQQCAGFKDSMKESKRTRLYQKIMDQIVQSLENMTDFKMKTTKDKVVHAMELAAYVVRTAGQQHLDVTLVPLTEALQGLAKVEGIGQSRQVEDNLWRVLHLLGVTRPKKDKRRKRKNAAAGDEPAVEGEEKTEGEEAPPPPPLSNRQKKRGKLPETKKRKNRKGKPEPIELAAQAEREEAAGTPSKKRKTKGGAAEESAAENKKKKAAAAGEGLAQEPPQEGEEKKKKKWRPPKRKPKVNMSNAAGENGEAPKEASKGKGAGGPSKQGGEKKTKAVKGAGNDEVVAKGKDGQKSSGSAQKDSTGKKRKLSHSAEGVVAASGKKTPKDRKP